jgi:hypothetical protein
MKADQLRKETSGLYTLTEIHVRTASAIEQVDRAATRAAIEKEIPSRFATQLKALGERHALTAELQMLINQSLRSVCATAYTGWQEQTGERFDDLLKQAKADNADVNKT